MWTENLKRDYERENVRADQINEKRLKIMEESLEGIFLACHEKAPFHAIYCITLAITETNVWTWIQIELNFFAIEDPA